MPSSSLERTRVMRQGGKSRHGEAMLLTRWAPCSCLKKASKLVRQLKKDTTLVKECVEGDGASIASGIIALNRKTIASGNAILTCPSKHCRNLFATLALVIFKVLELYETLALKICRQMPSVESIFDNSPVVESYGYNGKDLAYSTIQLVLSEIRSTPVFIDRFSSTFRVFDERRASVLERDAETKLANPLSAVVNEQLVLDMKTMRKTVLHRVIREAKRTKLLSTRGNLEDEERIDPAIE